MTDPILAVAQLATGDPLDPRVLHAARRLGRRDGRACRGTTAVDRAFAAAAGRGAALSLGQHLDELVRIDAGIARTATELHRLAEDDVVDTDAGAEATLDAPPRGVEGPHAQPLARLLADRARRAEDATARSLSARRERELACLQELGELRTRRALEPALHEQRVDLVEHTVELCRQAYLHGYEQGRTVWWRRLLDAWNRRTRPARPTRPRRRPTVDRTTELIPRSDR